MQIRNRKSQPEIKEVQGLRALEKPQRWDAPYSLETPNPTEARLMTDQDVEEVLASELFESMDETAFSRLPLRDIIRNDARIRYYMSGDTIVRQGDYGNSAFIILSGSCQAVLSDLKPDLLGRKIDKKKSWLNSLICLMVNPDSPEEGKPESFRFVQKKTELKAEKSENFVYVQDVPNIIKPISEQLKTEDMLQGTLFGELSALGRVQRAITILAASSPTKVLEIRWQGLRDIMSQNAEFKQRIDRNFRKYSLMDALRASKVIGKAQLSDAKWQHVVQSAIFQNYGSYDWYRTYQKLKREKKSTLSAEPIVVAQDQHLNGLLLIRSGFARQSVNYGKGEVTKGYLGKGEIYGLSELMESMATGNPVASRSTIRAAGYVDVVHLSTIVFEKEIFPNLPEKLKAQLLEKYQSGAKPQSNGVEKITPALMEFFADNRFLNGTKTMVIDLDRCTRCDDCVRACAAGHSNNPRFIRHGKIHGHHMIANACMHCTDPVCMIGCPTGAISRRQDTGEIVINQKTCIGCSTCATSCPYENIRMVNIRDTSQDSSIMVDTTGKAIEKATKCDLCSEHKGGPACERACPHDALKRVNLANMGGVSKWLNR